MINHIISIILKIFDIIRTIPGKCQIIFYYFISSYYLYDSISNKILINNNNYN